jgi:uncharacterized membrane protein (DUF4010 family)
MDPTLVRNFALALFIGALMGLEREKRIAEKGFGVGGLRTFILLSQAGAVSAWLSAQSQNVWIFAFTLLAAAGLLLGGYFLQARVKPDSIGLTTEIAALSAFLLGGVTLFGFPEVAVSLAIVDSALLAYKRPLHEMVGKISHVDLYAALKLLIATFVILPLLPNREIDPWGAINPYKAWWLVILIAGLSFVGYVAMRLLGPARGTALTGLFGGLVSSTAVALSFARESVQENTTPHLASALGGGVILSWVVMFARILVIVAVIFPPLALMLAIPLAVMIVLCVAFAAFIFLRAREDAAGPPQAGEVPLENPFSLWSAMKFAAFFLIILTVVRLAQLHLPAESVYIVAGVAGLADVDAISLSMANLAHGGSSEVHIAALAILIAVVANTLVKGGIVLLLGAPEMKTRVTVAGALVVVAAVVSGFLL